MKRTEALREIERRKQAVSRDGVWVSNWAKDLEEWVLDLLTADPIVESTLCECDNEAKYCDVCAPSRGCQYCSDPAVYCEVCCEKNRFFDVFDDD